MNGSSSTELSRLGVMWKKKNLLLPKTCRMTKSTGCRFPRSVNSKPAGVGNTPKLSRGCWGRALACSSTVE